MWRSTRTFWCSGEQGLELSPIRSRRHGALRSWSAISTICPGFSIVPQRTADDGSIAYSPYIGYELSLARRSGLPRLMFVDDEVLNRHRARFPPDVIPFVRSAPDSDRFRHVDAIKEFRKALEDRATNRKRKYRDRSVTVVTAGGPSLLHGADALMGVLRDKAYDPRPITPSQLPDALDDVGLLEVIMNSEMCVFLLDQQVTHADVLLGMAYAHYVPSIRLQYDPAAAKVEVAAESGRIRWSSKMTFLWHFKIRWTATGWVLYGRSAPKTCATLRSPSARRAPSSFGIERWPCTHRTY